MECILAQGRQYPSFNYQHARFNLRLIPRLSDASGNDYSPVVLCKIAIGRVQIWLVVTGIFDGGFPVVWHSHGWHTLEELKSADVGANPGGQIPVPGRLGVGVVAGAQDGHENRGLVNLAGFTIDNWDGRTGMIDEHLLAHPVILSQDQIELLNPAVIELAEATVLVAIRLALFVFLPEQLKRHVPVAAEFFVDRCKIGKTCLASSCPGIIGKELALQRPLIQVRGQGPSQAGVAGPAQIVSNSGVGNQTTPGDLPVLQS